MPWRWSLNEVSWSEVDIGIETGNPPFSETKPGLTRTCRGFEMGTLALGTRLSSASNVEPQPLHSVITTASNHVSSEMHETLQTFLGARCC